MTCCPDPLKVFGAGYSRHKIVASVLNKLSLSYQVVHRADGAGKSRNYEIVEASVDDELKWMIGDYKWHFLECLLLLAKSELKKLEADDIVTRDYWYGWGNIVSDALGREYWHEGSRRVITTGQELYGILPSFFVTAFVYRVAFVLADVLASSNKTVLLERLFRIEYANARRRDNTANYLGGCACGCES